jgi:signal transduction histidine kinase
MRQRMLRSAITVSLAAVLVLGIPLGVAGTRLIRTDARQSLEHDADNIASTVEDNFEHGQKLTRSILSRAAPAGQRVIVAGQDGSIITVGAVIKGPILEARSHVAKNAGVLVQTSARNVNARIKRLWLLVGTLAVGGVGAGVALALLQAKRLSAPLDALANSSRLLGGGDFSARAAKHGIPEIDAVAEALNASAAQIAELMATERRFASNVSHQLRTPLTGIRMRLEELAGSDDLEQARVEARAALQQVDRLTSTITEILQLTRTGRLAGRSVVDLPDLVRRHIDDWRDAYRSNGIDVTFRSDDLVAKASATPGVVGQALDVLLDNSIKHGRGPVEVSLQKDDGHVLIYVADQGPGISEGLEDDIFDWSTSTGGGMGVGLPLARTLVESDGGRLTLTRAHPAEFEIALPAAE